MKALLDTHTFLWWNMNDPQLSVVARQFIADPQNEIVLSSVSAWEIAIKASNGRLALPEIPEDYVMNRIILHGFTAMPIHIKHAVQVFHLPHHHKDPFDRLLVVQSVIENIPLITGDTEIAKYGVTIIW